MERVPFHDCEMEISIQYHVMLIRQSSDQILMRCYTKGFILLIAPIPALILWHTCRSENFGAGYVTTSTTSEEGEPPGVAGVRNVFKVSVYQIRH